MKPDQLQNELLTISHHLDDMESAIKQGELEYALMGLKDARESLGRLQKFLPPELQGEVGRMAEGTDKTINNIARLLTEDPNLMENPAVGIAARAVGSMAAGKAIDSMTSDDDEEDIEDVAEGRHYLRRTSKNQEKKLKRANEKADRASGMPGYPHLNKARREFLGEIEKKRPLRRSEFINKYGYEAWLDYTEKHGLPETHKWADAEEGREDPLR